MDSSGGVSNTRYTLDTPQILGKYRIIEPLGRGAFATVYKAEDTTLKGPVVALKVLDPILTSDPSFVNRFQHEAEIMAGLFHPNIAMVYGLGQADGRYFLVMRYIPGMNLEKCVEEKGLLEFDQITSVLQQVGAALDYAHSQHAIHRDVKPSNIILDDSGHVTLTDFGIAKVLGETTVRSSSGKTPGTPAYASPEQARSIPLDGRSDLFSLGVVAYELCTGKKSFIADTPTSMYYKIVHEEPPAPSSVNPRVAAPLERVLLKAMAKEPDQRYQSGAEFAAAFAAAVDQVNTQYVQTLFQQASAAADRYDFNAADNNLNQILTIKPKDGRALDLLNQVRAKRAWATQYQEVAAALDALRTKANALQHASVGMPDSKAIFAVFNPPPAPKPMLNPPPATDPVLKPARVFPQWMLGIFLGLSVIALLRAIWLLGSTFIVTGSLIYDVAYGNLFLGISIGAGAVSLLVLLVTRRK